MDFIQNIYRTTFDLLKTNMVLVQPLILFFILAGIIFMPLGNDKNLSNILIVLLCVGLVSVVFNAGWYSMFHKCIITPPNPNLTKAEQTIKSLELFKEFFPGVALYFIPFLGGSLLYLALLVIIFIAAYNWGIEHIGIPLGIPWEQLFSADQTSESVRDFFNKLSPGVKYQIALWEVVVIIALLVNYLLNYLTMFWAQSIVFLKVNPVSAFIKSIKLVVQNPVRTFIISLSFSLCLQITFLISIVPFILLQFIGLALYILVIVYFNLLIFVYFDKKQLGNNSRSDCFR